MSFGVKIFDRYITKQVFAATLVCIVLFVVIWIAPETLLKVIKRTLAGIYTPWVGIQLLINEIPKIVGKALPVGLLLGTLFTFDKLSKDFELTILRGIGLTFWRIVTPIIALSVIFTVICFSLYNTLIPQSEKKILALKNESYQTHFVFTIKNKKNDRMERILVVPRYHNNQISNPIVLNFNENQYTDTSVLNNVLMADYAVYKNIDHKAYKKEEVMIKDDISMPFKNDENLIGVWRVCGFVQEIRDFKGEIKGDEQEEFGYYKDVAIMDNGKLLFTLADGGVLKDNMRWTKDYIILEVQEVAQKYIIKEINGDKYLFMEHKSGDYSYGGMKPYYYVFKRAGK